MDPLCEVCGVVRAVVYCKSDSARLCLHCDGDVHSANCLSRRHHRSLICDKCSSQAAIVRCVDEEMCVCQGCDSDGNGCNGAGHLRKELDCYSGCPSPSEFTRMWSALFEMPNGNVVVPDATCSSLLARGNEGSLVASKLNELASCFKVEQWSIPPPVVHSIPYDADPASFFSEESALPKQDCPNISDLGFNEGDDLLDGVELDGVTLSFDCDNDFLGTSQQTHPTYSGEDRELNCLVMEKNLSVTESNSHDVENALEVTSSGHQECMGFQSPHMVAAESSTNLLQTLSATANSMLMNPSTTCNNRSIGLGFLPSSMSLSLSNITGESSAAADFQDCGLSPLFLTSESNIEVCQQARNEAKMRYNEKKRNRTFVKQIRYATRKARADTRRRVKGRFVKAGETYDYDPLTRDF